jgi:hypothetical protein
MKWRAQAADGRELIIECDNRVDARVLALHSFHVNRDELNLTQADDPIEPHLALRWIRSPGPPRTMHPEVRERFGTQWGPWKDERDFVLGSP